MLSPEGTSLGMLEGVALGKIEGKLDPEGGRVFIPEDGVGVGKGDGTYEGSSDAAVVEGISLGTVEGSCDPEGEGVTASTEGD